MNERAPGYYAIIPSTVRYDDRIPPNAKLLYGEISALLGCEGYCYASNAYFADLYKLSERTISKLFSVLQENGYIVIQLEKDDSGKAIRRKVSLAASTTDGHPLEEIFYTPRKYFLGGVEENFQYTNSSNNKYIEKENKKEKDAADIRQAKTGFDPMPLMETFAAENGIPGFTEKLIAAMERFAENRKAMKKPIRSKAAVTTLCNRLRSGSNGDVQVMIEMLDTAVLHNWQSVYPLKDAPTPESRKSRRDEEWL